MRSFSSSADPSYERLLPRLERLGEKVLSRERDRALSRFLEDCDQFFLLLQLDRGIVDRAVELTQNHRLRGYDAIQLATALVANADLLEQEHPPLIFVTSDEDLRAAAHAESLATEEPVDG